MFKNLKREIVYKTTVGAEFVRALLSAVLFTLLSYYCVTELNRVLVDVLLEFQDADFTFINFALAVLPIFIILFMCFYLGKMFIAFNGETVKTTKKATKTSTTKKKKPSKK